jgi:hypothetical protein
MPFPLRLDTFRVLAVGATALLLAHCAAPGASQEDPTGADENAFVGVKAEDTEPEPTFEDDPTLTDDGAAESGGMCTGARPTCPEKTNTPIEENGGLRPIEGCAFHLGDRNAWAANGALVDRLSKQLPVVSVGDVLADANREASEIDSLSRVADFRQGFKWNLDDTMSTKWWPQGITGSGDASATGMVDGKRVLLVSSYDKGDRGVRIAFADITNPKDVRYRFALLVTVRDDGGRTELDPVPVHAGGLVWYGRYLYVPDTGRGFRVFDMERILRVPDGGENIGFNASSGKYSAADYRYVIPQVDDYMLSASCKIAFSFASLDRSTTPHSIVSGEYKMGNEGRLVRWYLDPQSNKLAAPYYAREAHFAQQTRIQGALSWKGTWWVQSAAQSLPINGELYRLNKNTKSKGFPQPPGIEDLYHDPTTGLLWSATEFPGFRYVYAAPLSKY